MFVFENRILRRIFGPKRDENGKWKRLHNAERNNEMSGSEASSRLAVPSTDFTAKRGIQSTALRLKLFSFYKTILNTITIIIITKKYIKRSSLINFS